MIFFSRNDALLDLLKQGCTVLFPEGYELSGIPEENQIHCTIAVGRRTLECITPLTSRGIREAMEEKSFYVERIKKENIAKGKG